MNVNNNLRLNIKKKSCKFRIFFLNFYFNTKPMMSITYAELIIQMEKSNIYLMLTDVAQIFSLW